MFQLWGKSVDNSHSLNTVLLACFILLMTFKLTIMFVPLLALVIVFVVVVFFISRQIKSKDKGNRP